jgi:hypothetical protein
MQSLHTPTEGATFSLLPNINDAQYAHHNQARNVPSNDLKENGLFGSVFVPWTKSVRLSLTMTILGQDP